MFFLTQNFIAIFGKLVLLRLAAMILERQYNGHVRGDESGVANRINNVLKKNIGAHGSSVSYDRFLVFGFACNKTQRNNISTSKLSSIVYRPNSPVRRICSRPTTPAGTFRPTIFRRIACRSNTCYG